MHERSSTAGRPGVKRPNGILRVGRRSWVLNSILGIVLVGVIVAVWFAVGTASPAATVAKQTATVETGPITATVTGSGNLASSRTSSLSFGASGTVTAVDVKVGDKVTKGDELATIDTTAAKQSLKAAQAQLKSAQASYDDAVDSRSTSTAGTADAIDAAELSVSSANAGVPAAQQQLKDDTRTQDQMVTEAKDARAKGTGSKSQVDAAVAMRNQVIAKDKQGIIQAKAQVSTAKSNLAKAQSGSSDSSSGSSSSSESTEAKIAAADVTVEDAKSTVQDAEDALDDTTITAPFSGTITAINGQEGDDVSAGTSSNSGTSSSTASTGSSSTGSSSTGSTGSTGSTSTGSSSSSSSFITMASLTSMDVTATIAEADIGAVKVGQQAVVTLSASSDTADGTVTQVSPEGTTTSNVVQYPMTVTITDPPATARLGASVSVVITTGSAENVLVLPTSAVTTTGTRHTVAVLKNGVATTTAVQIGLEGTSTTEITGGVAAGDIVEIPTSTASASTGVPGFGGGGTGAARSLVGGR